MADSSPLLDMQARKGIPLSEGFSSTVDPLLPAQANATLLAHFFEEIYDLSDESHLSRLLAVLLGDSGVGLLRKQFTYSQVGASLLTAHFYDIDRLFSSVFGFRRLLTESLAVDPFTETGTAEEWEALFAADSGYLSRCQQFVQGVNAGATLPGMYALSQAVLGSPVRIYEAYHFLDDETAYGSTGTDVFNTWGDLEDSTYGDLAARTYAELEGSSAYHGRANHARTEFIVRPLRSITAEEQYHLQTVLNRLKPVGTMLTIDPSGVEVFTDVQVAAAYSPSSYWHVRREVASSEANSWAYERYDDGRPVEQPRPAFSESQGEEWFYNGDVLSVSAYAEVDGVVTTTQDWERVSLPDGSFVDYDPSQAMTDAADIARGRLVREGVMVSNVLDRHQSLGA